MVHAGRVFSLASSEPGRMLWSVREGRSPGGGGLVHERLMVFERADLMEIAPAPGLRTGSLVEADQTIATVRSLATEHRFDKLVSERRALEARRELLGAGERDAAVAAAEQQVAVEEAAHRASEAELARVRILAASGLTSEAELERAEDDERVLRERVELARSQVTVAVSAARPEAIGEVEASIAAVNATIEETVVLREAEVLTSPIRGLVEVGGGLTEIKVFDLEHTFLHVAVPLRSSSQLAVGMPLSFVTPACPGHRFSGALVEVASSTIQLVGHDVVWVSAEIDDPDGLLRDGMTGKASLGQGEPVWLRVLGIAR
jgi:multidrug efflux pump subunit AcrA (membrane-fusion protein)